MRIPGAAPISCTSTPTDSGRPSRWTTSTSSPTSIAASSSSNGAEGLVDDLSDSRLDVADRPVAGRARRGSRRGAHGLRRPSGRGPRCAPRRWGRRVILAIDTSTALTSVAVVDDGLVLAEERHLDARRHAEVLAPMLRDVLERAGVGPTTSTPSPAGSAPVRTPDCASASRRHWRSARPGADRSTASARSTRSPRPPSTPVSGRSSASRPTRVARRCTGLAYSAEGDRLTGPLVSIPADIDVGLRAGIWVGHGVLGPSGGVRAAPRRRGRGRQRALPARMLDRPPGRGPARVRRGNRPDRPSAGRARR